MGSGRFSVPSAALLAIAAASPQAQQVHKCTVEGKSVYQQEPCAPGAVGSQVRVFSGGETAPAALKAPESPARSEAPRSNGPAPQVAAATAPRKSPLDREADMCLDWYRAMLRDPRSAYYVEPSKDGRVLSMYIKATNGFGGYVTKLAKCEIKDGVIDNDWTRIHANRNQW